MSHACPGCSPLFCMSVLPATHTSIMRQLRQLQRNVLLLTGTGDKQVTHLLMCLHEPSRQTSSGVDMMCRDPLA